MPIFPKKQRLTQIYFQESLKKSYTFEYSVQEDVTGITHSRKETADENGVVRGVYEILEPNCIIRRVEYQADHVKGFKVLKTAKRSCQESAKKQHAVKLSENPHAVKELPYIVTPTATVLTSTKRPRRKVNHSGYISPPPAPSEQGKN